MKYKAADQIQDSAPQGTQDCWQSLTSCGSSAQWKVLEGTGQEQHEQGKTPAAWHGVEKKLPCNSYWDWSRECKQPSVHKEVITSESSFPSSSPSCLISKSCSVY